MPNYAPETPYDSYCWSKIDRKILFEARQRELDLLEKMTGEILLNEYVTIPDNTDLVA